VDQIGHLTAIVLTTPRLLSADTPVLWQSIHTLITTLATVGLVSHPLHSLLTSALPPHLLSGMEWSSLSWSGFCSPNVTSFSTLTAAPSPKRCHPFFDHGCSHSFPQAALVHQVPLVSLWSSVAIFTRDIRLPYCGDFVFSKRALGEGGREVVYEEGTFDKRQVVGKMLALNQCPLMLSEWGLSQLYCLEKGVTE
jgi:hypothetical protein